MVLLLLGPRGWRTNAHISDDDIVQILQGHLLADMSRLVFRDPDRFRAGELHRHASRWNTLLDDLTDERFSTRFPVLVHLVMNF